MYWHWMLLAHCYAGVTPPIDLAVTAPPLSSSGVPSFACFWPKCTQREICIWQHCVRLKISLLKSSCRADMGAPYLAVPQVRSDRQARFVALDFTRAESVLHMAKRVFLGYVTDQQNRCLHLKHRTTFANVGLCLAPSCSLSTKYAALFLQADFNSQNEVTVLRHFAAFQNCSFFW